MKTGDTFLLLDRHTGVRHLYVVLSDPMQSSDQIFIVMVSTRGDGKEECCVLRTGDHPFIQHDSVTVYRIPPAELVSLSQLDQWKGDGRLTQSKNHIPVTETVLERMRQGYSRSRYRTDRVYQLLFRQGLVD